MDSGASPPDTPIVIADKAAVAACCGLEHKVRIGSDLKAPLIILVHGRAGNFDVMWTFKRAIPSHWNVIAPQAPLAESQQADSQPLGGFSWWEVREGSRGEPAAMQGAASLLSTFVIHARDYYKLAPQALLGVGFSQGAGLISVVLQRPHQPFKAVGLLAGFVIKNHHPVDIRPCPVQICHGERDEVVPFDLARTGAEQLKSLGFSVSIASDPVGHKIGPAGVRGLKSFLEDNGK